MLGLVQLNFIKLKNLISVKKFHRPALMLKAHLKNNNLKKKRIKSQKFSNRQVVTEAFDKQKLSEIRRNCLQSLYLSWINTGSAKCGFIRLSRY